MVGEVEEVVEGGVERGDMAEMASEKVLDTRIVVEGVV